MRRFAVCAITVLFPALLAGLSAHAQQAGSDYTASYSSYYVSPYATHYSLEDEWDSDPPGELILADVLILRPLGIASQIVGLAGSIVSIPWAASSCSGCLVQRELIQEPFEYTWCRRLGDLDDY